MDIIDALVAREKRAAAGRALQSRSRAWKREVEHARWKRPTYVKAVFGSADIIGGTRIVFDICGNNYRLVVDVNYAGGVVRIRFAGNHVEYNNIDARTV